MHDEVASNGRLLHLLSWEPREANRIRSGAHSALQQHPSIQHSHRLASGERTRAHDLRTRSCLRILSSPRDGALSLHGSSVASSCHHHIWALPRPVIFIRPRQLHASPFAQRAPRTHRSSLVGNAWLLRSSFHAAPCDAMCSLDPRRTRLADSRRQVSSPRWPNSPPPPPRRSPYRVLLSEMHMVCSQIRLSGITSRRNRLHPHFIPVATLKTVTTQAPSAQAPAPM